MKINRFAKLGSLPLLPVAVFLIVFISDSCVSTQVREEYKMRASNFDGKKFSNEHEFKMMVKVPKNSDSGVVSKKGLIPKDVIPVAKPDFYNASTPDKVFFTWFGHSSLMIQMHGKTILFDPVFSKRASPESFTGPERFSDLPCKIEDLPEIDILIITHDHYDHLDKPTIKKIDSKVKKYIVPLGIERHLVKFGVKKEKIRNMAWWEEVNEDGLTIACTPAQHFSGRKIIDNFSTLWASWVLFDENHKIFECGDSGWDTHFARINEKYGNFDIAFMEGAQYDLRWPSVHMTPEQAFDAAQALGTEILFPIHWGTFKLAHHPWDDNVCRLVKRSEESGGKIKIVTPLIGETIPLSKITDCQTRWYEKIQ